MDNSLGNRRSAKINWTSVLGTYKYYTTQLRGALACEGTPFAFTRQVCQTRRHLPYDSYCLRRVPGRCMLPPGKRGRETAMGSTVAETDQRLISFGLPSIPESVPMARFHVRAALGFHELGEYADNAEIITSELVTNAIQHVCGDGTGNDRGNPGTHLEPRSRDHRRVGLLARRPGHARDVGRQ